MPDYCKNCGAKITENDQFCPDCGKQLQATSHNFCPNCGHELDNNVNFCGSCGHELPKKAPKAPKIKEDSFFKKHQVPIIIIGGLLILIIILIAAISTISVYGTQQVQVDTIGFEIPDTFKENTLYYLSEIDDGIRTESKYWEDGNDYIQIDVMYSTKTYVDANKVNNNLGGERQSMYGYDGYYNELTDAYSFSFVKDNKLCTVYTSDYNLLSQVDVL